MHFLLTKKIKIKLNLAVLGYTLEFKKKCIVFKNNTDILEGGFILYNTALLREVSSEKL